MSSMHKLSDRAYYQRREQEELVKALACENETAGKVHLHLAKEYRKRADKLGDHI